MDISFNEHLSAIKFLLFVAFLFAVLFQGVSAQDQMQHEANKVQTKDTSKKDLQKKPAVRQFDAKTLSKVKEWIESPQVKKLSKEVHRKKLVAMRQAINVEKKARANTAIEKAEKKKRIDDLTKEWNLARKLKGDAIPIVPPLLAIQKSDFPKRPKHVTGKAIDQLESIPPEVGDVGTPKSFADGQPEVDQ